MTSARSVRAIPLSVIVTTTLILSPLAAQRRAAEPPQAMQVSTTIDLKVGGVAYTFTGLATCEHLQRGSIYDTPAERWSVQQADGNRSLSLTLWRPLSGGDDMVNLSLSTGGKRADVNTVKGRQQTQTTGSGTVKLVPAGKGGTFAVDAKAGSGTAISGTIKCQAFTPSTPVAGD